MMVTPFMAENWLRKNVMNRRVQTDRVAQYAAAMSRGAWRFTHQGIAFFDDDTLADGQHRLLAIQKSETTVKMQVTFGLAKKEAAPHIDDQMPRNVTHSAAILGTPVSTFIVACARQLFEQYVTQHDIGLWSRMKIDNEMLMQFIEASRPALEFSAPTVRTKGLRSAGVRSVFAAAWYTVDRDRLASFKTHFETGVIESQADTAAIRLRDWVMTTPVAGHSINVESRKRAAAAIASYLDRRPLARLFARETVSFPIPKLI
jgi:hypothetical protein